MDAFQNGCGWGGVQDTMLSLGRDSFRRLKVLMAVLIIVLRWRWVPETLQTNCF